MIGKRMAVWLVAGLLSFVPLAAQEFDDCDGGFLAFVGSSAYQFNPYASGELGSTRLFAVFSFQEAAATGVSGHVAWRLEIAARDGRLVRTAHGSGELGSDGRVLAEFPWDGRDQDGRIVPDGLYRFTFHGRFVPGGLREDLDGEVKGLRPFGDAMTASTDEVVVNLGLSEAESRELRASALATSCQIQQNLPLEPGFPYNFYYGSTHSHSNFSDGGQPLSSCSSGNAYGSGSYDPAAVFDFARTIAGLDYWVVNEHNHLIENAIATNDPPVTEAKVKARYQQGLAAAQAATVDGQFVAIYGMEWGVTTNADQGHVTLLETPLLFGWESCSVCNGPDPECTPGTNCYFDVFTPKRYGYATLYARSVANPSPVGPLGIFCHPGSGNFDNLAFDANADQALQGIAVRSGLAFTTATNCADANVGATDYSSFWKTALNMGFHLGPTADHDTHCANYGLGIPNRTVYLLPNNATPVLTRTAWMQAHKARHFFATEDPNAQLIFATSDNSHIMGDIFTAPSSVTLRAAVYDPDGEGLSRLEIWRGQIGAGVPSAPYWSSTTQDNVTLTESPGSGEYYYFVHAVQADGHDLWSSPMWITFGAGCSDSDTPAVAFVHPTEGATVSGVVTLQAQASDPSCGVASVEFAVNGGPWQAASLNPQNGLWELSWDTAQTACFGPATVTVRATDSASPSHTAAASVNVTMATSDTQAPTVSIVSPASGTTLACTDSLIAVSAGDASGVASVEVQVDGGAWQPASYNAATGLWEVVWASSQASPGTHTLQARAIDASCSANTAVSAPVPVTVTACGTDISGWKLVQANASYTFVFPQGTRIPAGGYLVIARNASKTAFEAFWGVSLGSNVTFVNAAGAFPAINGDERFTLYDASGRKLDGATVAMPAGGGKTVQRKDPCLAAGKSSSWTISSYTAATPGSGAGAGCGKGVVINEFADPSGSGDYAYEFVELHNDN